MKCGFVKKEKKIICILDYVRQRAVWTVGVLKGTPNLLTDDESSVPRTTFSVSLH